MVPAPTVRITSVWIGTVYSTFISISLAPRKFFDIWQSGKKIIGDVVAILPEIDVGVLYNPPAKTS